MTETSISCGAANTSAQPPTTFIEVMEIPMTKHRTAIAIMNDGHRRAVSVTFSLKERRGDRATYSAICPRCDLGEILVDVILSVDGSFAQQPACPTLCIACEDRLDAILEPPNARDKEDRPSGRAAMNNYLKGMARPWD